MNTFTRMWSDVTTPAQAKERIQTQIQQTGITHPQNLEEQALSLVGVDIYKKLIQSYTEKQWGRPCKELPAFIIRRVPVRFRFDNNYYDHPHQGIPLQGYTQMIQNMLAGIDVRLGIDFLHDRTALRQKAKTIIFTGPIDEYYDYCYGPLQYRSLRFETETLDLPDYQGVAGMNYTDPDTAFTRIIEHKHFLFGDGNPDQTVITREYALSWKPGAEPYYPVNDDENNARYQRYAALAAKDDSVRFGGRLGTYRYLDMDQVIRQALEDAACESKQKGRTPLL